MRIGRRLRDRLASRSTEPCPYCGLSLASERRNCPACGYSDERGD